MTDPRDQPSYSRGDAHDELRSVIRERAAEARKVALEGLGKRGHGIVSVNRDLRSGAVTLRYSAAADHLEVPSREFADAISDYDPVTEFAACLRSDYTCLTFRFAELGLPDNHDVEPAKIELRDIDDDDWIP